ncbi:hypothetical protein ACFO5R_18855 [Halosolutus amylolyticus]|uniref:Uncharacterized protein n=1 Tax=Halosolutus amylolyticus TaxID=2932267 RepID=A0ABD5PTU6_9EURY|nr:hypothetical protein [Halosolutus amylolyticus]
MSAPDDRLPATTARTIALAALVGTLAMAAQEPSAAAGALFGIAAVVVTRWFDGSYRRVTVAAALLPVPVLGAIAVAAVGADPVGGVLTILSAIVGIGVAVVVGRPTPVAIERAGSAALYAGVAAGGVAVLAFGVSTAGTLRSALASALWVTGDGVVGLLVGSLVAAVAVAGGLFAVPPAAFATPADRDSYARTRAAITWTIGYATLLVFVLVVAATVLAWFVPPTDGIAAVLADSALVRGLIAALTGGGVVTAAVGTIVRASWFGTTGRSNAVVPLLAGAVCGVVLIAPIAIGASGGRIALVAGLFGAATIVLGLSYAAVRVALETTVTDGESDSATAIAAALVGGGLVGGATVDAASGLATIRVGAGPLVAIATGLFVYDVGRYGRTLAREVGREGASRRAQFVQLGWRGAVAAVGVPVAAVGFLGATVLAPTLSVPATVAVLGGVAAIVAGAWLLFR